MTVKCLTQHEQQQVFQHYQKGIHISDLAGAFNCSTRTIHRVLREQIRNQPIKPESIQTRFNFVAVVLRFFKDLIQKKDVPKHG